MFFDNVHDSPLPSGSKFNVFTIPLSMTIEYLHDSMFFGYHSHSCYSTLKFLSLKNRYRVLRSTNGTRAKARAKSKFSGNLESPDRYRFSSHCVSLFLYLFDLSPPRIFDSMVRPRA